jgi:hypothetical protein
VDPVVVLLLLLAELPLVVPLLKKRKKRRRKRVCYTDGGVFMDQLLIYCTEKEESDEDMGFGLFD